MWFKPLSFALCATFLLACVTPGKFEALQQRVLELEKATKGQGEMVGTHHDRLENLNKLLKRAEKSFQTRGAETLATVQELDDLSRKNLGAIEELQFQVEKNTPSLEEVVKLIDRKYGVTITALPKDLPTAPDKLFETGQEHLKRGLYRQARAIFRKYITGTPDGEHAAESQHSIGESYFLEQDYESAIAEFKQVHDAYAKSPQMPPSLLRIGDILVAQKKCSKAKSIYGFLRQTASKTPEAAEAKERLKTLKEKCGK